VAWNPAAVPSPRMRRNVADWRELAACRHIDPELFFPVGSTGPATDRIEAAKRVCRSCEVIEPCLEFALASNQEAGVWGGTSEDERRRLRKAWLALRRRGASKIQSAPLEGPGDDCGDTTEMDGKEAS